jgi:aryl-alcohol dehydrogenase-like predicted oxidoreductase
MISYFGGLQGVARAQREGKVKHVGLCNVTVDEIKAARQVVDVVSVQNKFNMWDRSCVL